MARFSLELRDLEAATALEALGMVPETQWPGTEEIIGSDFPSGDRVRRGPSY